MKIGILTDSTCDLPQKLIDEYNIHIIPLTLRIGEEQYKDRKEINSDQFLNRIKQSDVMPTTSQPSVGEFEALYKELNKDYDHVISMHLSSHLSGTVHSAQLALKENPEFNITVIDSKTASMGLGFLDILAAKLIAKGLELEKIVKILKRARRDIEIYLTVDNLSFFEKGGRISKAGSFIGDLINLKPILKLDFDSKAVEPMDKARGRKNTHKKLLELVEKYITKDKGNKGEYWFGFVHGELKYTTTFKKMYQNKIDNLSFGCKYYQNTVGAVIGSHTGPTVYGVVLFKGGKYLNEQF